MSDCNRLCTAVKCEELENRIEQLEQIIEQLKQINVSGQLTNESLDIEINNSFNSDTASIDLSYFCSDERLDNHVSTRINENSSLSHDYNPDFSFDLDINENQNDFLLRGTLKIEDVERFSLVTWDKHETDFEYVFADITQLNGQQEIFIAVKINGIVKSDTVLINLPELQLDHVIIQASAGNSPNEYQLFSSVQINGQEENDTTTFFVPEPQLDHVIIQASAGDSPNQYQLFSSVQINGQEENDITTFFVPDMNCQDLEDLIKTENNQNQALLDALYYLIELRTGQLETKIDEIEVISNEIYQELTQDISGTIDSDYSYIFEADADGNPKPIHPKNTTFSTNYLGRGIVGIKNLLELLSQNQERIFDATTKGISPIINLDLSDGLKEICADDRIDPNSYSDDNDFIDAATDILIDIFSDTASDFILKSLKTKNIALRGAGGVPGFVLSTTLDWGINYLLEKNFKKETTAFDRVCRKIDNLDFDCGDVVAITASDKVIKNVFGKNLVLHFVTFDNYPKRAVNSGYRPVQIPQAKEEYDWCEHFENLRWTTGNYYAKLHLKFDDNNKWKTPITGYFSSKSKADDYFNQVLALTNLSEDYRSYHPNTARNNFAVKETRPYRAFIVSVNENNQPVCETKYVPPEEECS